MCAISSLTSTFAISSPNEFLFLTGQPDGPVLFCWLAYVVVCNAAGGRTGRPEGNAKGAWGWGERSGEVLRSGYVPSPMYSFFELKMACFGAFWELILLQLNCLSYTHKPVSLDFGW